MDHKYFPLGEAEDNRIVKILRILFGVACIALGVYWLIFNIKSEKPEPMLWIADLFLLFFGVYQVLSGFGRTLRYIQIGSKEIILKKGSLGKPLTFASMEVEKIDILPLSITFIFKGGRKILLRLGTINIETNEKIVDELVAFAESNNVPFEIKEEL